MHELQKFSFCNFKRAYLLSCLSPRSFSSNLRFPVRNILEESLPDCHHVCVGRNGVGRNSFPTNYHNKTYCKLIMKSFFLAAPSPDSAPYSGCCAPVETVPLRDIYFIRKHLIFSDCG